MATVEKILFKKDGIWNEYNNLTLETSMFKDSKRGISFISLEGKDRLTDDKVKGFCHNRFKANFIFNNIDVKDLTIGQSLQIGKAIIKITKVGKECISECPIVKDCNVSCKLNNQVFFGQIVKEGLVNKNDEVLL